MGCVEGFDHDVFISYAHVDDRAAFGGDGGGWVSRLHEALDVLVGRRMGRLERFSIWRDAKLRGGDYYDDEIAARIRGSAVFVSVVSPGYLDSTYCLQELASFAGRPDLRVGNRSRLIRVDFDELRGDQTAPAEFGGMDGYRFFERDRSTDRVETLHRGERYEKLVEDLARDIADTLEAMRRAAPPKRAVAAGPTVYLARVPEELEGRRTALREAFAQYGVTVLPEWTEPPGAAGDRAALEAAVNDDLARASLSLHLVGASYGGHLFGDENNLSLFETQYDLALRAAAGGSLGTAPPEAGGAGRAPVLVWSPAELEPAGVEDERQKAFLRRIRNESSPHLEWLRQGVEDLKDLCFDRLGVERRKPSAAPADAGAMVFLSCPAEGRHHQDFQRLVGYLRDRGHDLLYPNWSEGDALSEDRVRYSDGVLILCVGEATAQWAEARAVEVVGFAKRRRERPMVAAVYDGPPPERDELPFDFRAVPKIPARAGFDEAALAPFLEELERRAAL